MEIDKGEISKSPVGNGFTNKHIPIDEDLLGTTKEEMPRISLNNAELVRRQYLSHIREAMVTIRPDGIQFNSSCIIKMPNTTHIQIFIDRNQKYMIIKACDELDKDGQRWCNIKDEQRKSRKISGRPFCEKVYKMMGWSKGYYYKACGIPALQADDEDELLFIFELTEYERYAMSSKARKSAGVDDEEISEDELNRINEEVQNRKREKKKSKYPDEWSPESFGQRAEEHRNRILIPRLEDLELLTEEKSDNNLYDDGEKL